MHYVETFGELGNDGQFIQSSIPADEVDFVFEYYVDGRYRFRADRTDGVYHNCLPIDDSSIQVFIPLSRLSLGCGELRRKLILKIPTASFPDNVQNTCIPDRTDYFLWNGPSDEEAEAAQGEISIRIIVGPKGDTPEFRVGDDFIQYRYTKDDPWKNLVALETLRKPATDAATEAKEAAGLADKKAGEAASAAGAARDAARLAEEKAAAANLAAEQFVYLEKWEYDHLVETGKDDPDKTYLTFEEG